jgi:ABC-type xylose transport system permease subunit|tara:strand:+ start:3008 stop:3238 length:231 start_codon:yes stop_codon:yes gene_type:complete
MKNLKDRWNAKTPKFWKRVRNIAITLGAIAGVILTAPVSLPAVVITAAGYLATAGTVAATLSQLTVEDKSEEIINQ